MHSNRMRTACSLPYRGVSVQGRSLSKEVSVQRVSVQGSLCPGESLSRGSLSRGSLSKGVSVGTPPQTETPSLHLTPPLPPVNRMTDTTCENITLPQISFAGGKYKFPYRHVRHSSNSGSATSRLPHVLWHYPVPI